MRPPSDLSAVIGGLRYGVDKSTLIASDAYWDGHNWERRGRNCFLYRTPGGRYFTVRLSQHDGESDTIDAVGQDDAINFWEGELREHAVEFEEAFPGVEVKDA